MIVRLVGNRVAELSALSGKAFNGKDSEIRVLFAYFRCGFAIR